MEGAPRLPKNSIRPSKPINGGLRQIAGGNAVAFPPPAIPGVGTSGGLPFVLEDRSGQGVQFLAENLTKFLAELRKRPELSGVFTGLSALSRSSLSTSIATKC